MDFASKSVSICTVLFLFLLTFRSNQAIRSAFGLTPISCVRLLETLTLAQRLFSNFPKDYRNLFLWFCCPIIYKYFTTLVLFHFIIDPFYINHYFIRSLNHYFMFFDQFFFIWSAKVCGINKYLKKCEQLRITKKCKYTLPEINKLFFLKFFVFSFPP